MKSLVLLYRSKKNEEVTIKEYSNITENNKHYLFGTNYLGNNVGVLKKCIGEVRIFDDYFGGKAAIYPIELPHMNNLYWYGGYFMFVNKNKYDENPMYYYNIIKNYREE